LILPKICGCVILFRPQDNVFDNIQSYYGDIDLLYVVDNSEREYVNGHLSDNLKKLGKVRYISNYENLGIAKALNQAVHEARKDGYEFILTMDQDSVVEDGYIAKIICLLKKNKLDIESLGIISPFHKTYLECMNNDKEEIVDKLIVMTSGNLLNIKAHEKVGGFWNELFIDWVDHEYCLRLKKNNYRVVQINTVVLYHSLGEIKKHSFLNKTFYSFNHSALRRYYQSRNSRYVVERYKNVFPEVILLERETLIYSLKSIIFFERDKINKLIMILKGYFDYKKKIFGKFLE
jgi:rhamnosyltransferase